MTAYELLASLHNQGFQLTPLPGDKLEVRPASKLPGDLREALRQRKSEVLALLKAQARDFLSRPLKQEDNPDSWDAWGPFMSWLCVEHPARFTAICQAEESIRELERQGVTEGPNYEQACATLLWVFEEARRLKLGEEVKVWIQ
jgi:hypothetical protein